MVGVAGKSKGCATCRRRKVKCDLAQPGCGRCAKAGLTCEGYDRYAVFIRKGIGGWEKRRPLEEAKPKTKVCASDSPRERKWHIEHSYDSKNPCDKVQPVEHFMTFPLQLKSVAIETVPFLDYFLRDFVCPSDPATLKQDYIDPEPWIEGLKHVKGSGTLLHTVLVAISMVYCGKMRRDLDLLLQGRSWYSRALCQLCDLLSDDEASRGDEVLKGISICMAYETVDPSDPTSSIGWIRHFVGMKKLLHHRGPNSFEDSQSRDILEDTRHMAMMAGLNRRESGFLAEDTWMTSPWTSSSKSVRQQVADCGLRLAKVFEIMDETRLQVEQFSTADTAELIEQCMVLDKTLQDLARGIPGNDDLSSRTGEQSSSPVSLPCSSMFESTSKLRLKITILDIRLRIHETIGSLACFGNLKEHKSHRLPSKLEGKALARSVLSLVSYYLSLDICSISKGRHLFALERAKAQFDSDDDEYLQCDALIRLVDLEDWSGGKGDQVEMRSVTTSPTWDDLDSWCVMVTSPRHLAR